MILLEQSILETVVDFDCCLLLCDNFNARIGNLNVCNDVNIHNMRENLFEESPEAHDHVNNTFGRSLLSLCAAFDLTILNGNIIGDKFDKNTYISTHGNSVIDYVIMSADLYVKCSRLKVIKNILSPHMPLEL